MESILCCGVYACQKRVIFLLIRYSWRFFEFESSRLYFRSIVVRVSFLSNHAFDRVVI